MLRISVITINRNNKAGLQRSLDSLAAQRVRPFEFIIVDGASGDGSAELALGSKLPTRVISEPDEGIYDAMNKGLKQCSGDYIYFLNSGDAFYDEFVIEQLANLSPGPEVYFGNMVWKSSGEKLVPPMVIDVPLFVLGTLWHPCVLVKTEVFAQHGAFNKQLKIAGDYEFLLRVLIARGSSYRYTDVTISLYDTLGISNDPAFAELEQRERAMSWELNFSKPVREALFDYVKLQRSAAFKWGTRFIRLFK